MAGIFNNQQFIFFSQSIYFLHFTRVPRKMNWNEGLCLGAYFLPYLIRININYILLYISKNWLSPTVEHTISRSYERDRRSNNLIPKRKAEVPLLTATAYCAPQ